jgi:predicted transcriptional regulator
MTDQTRETLLALTADIVAAHVSNNSVAVSDLPQLIGNVHAALGGLGGGKAAEPIEQAPAVSVRSSVKPDYIICLEDGKKMKMLKRHLMTEHQMTPAEYRAKWELPPSYPLVAPNYSEARRGLAHKIGLGRKRATKATNASKPGANNPPRKRPARKPRSPKGAPTTPSK